jgi:hypothetical protein
MATPLLKTPGVHSACYRTIEMVLRNHEDLGLVKSWRSWTGDSTDDDEFTPALCPLVKLTPYAPPSSQATEKTYNSDLYIKIESATAGTRADDGMDLWDLIMSALFPGDSSVKDLIGTALPGGVGGYALWLLQPAFGLEQTKDGPITIASGLIRIGILAPS